MQKNKVLVIFDAPGTYPANYTFEKELLSADWKAEKHVIKALNDLGHEVFLLGVNNCVETILESIKENKPDIIFNLAEQFLNESSFDRHLVGLFEMLKIPYTGPGPSSLFLCKNKGVAKQLLMHEKILTPAFQIFPRHQKIEINIKLKFPLLVKPLREEASYGITDKSLVKNVRELTRRIKKIHKHMSRDVLVEEFIEGRELYVSILGNKKPLVFPIREMVFSKMPKPLKQFATFRAKWDESYRIKCGIQNLFAQNISASLKNKIFDTSKRIYKLLYLSGYARLDFRLSKDNKLYFIEANPNPHIGQDEDFAQSASLGGFPYLKLIPKILELGFEEHTRFFER